MTARKNKKNNNDDDDAKTSMMRTGMKNSFKDDLKTGNIMDKELNKCYSMSNFADFKMGVSKYGTMNLEN